MARAWYAANFNCQCTEMRLTGRIELGLGPNPRHYPNRNPNCNPDRNPNRNSNPNPSRIVGRPAPLIISLAVALTLQPYN